ncbi:MAG: hypothetical protein HY517_02385 [Candidatus Aenigmarchaeota archaeon]|nr:hypothetical protein [Candidatus Aenigmarchaeota archaeon]
MVLFYLIDSVTKAVSARREARDTALRVRAYRLIEESSHDYPHFIGEDLLALQLGINPRKAAEVVQPLIEDGLLDVQMYSTVRIFRLLPQSRAATSDEPSSHPPA